MIYRHLSINRYWNLTVPGNEYQKIQIPVSHKTLILQINITLLKYLTSITGILF